MAKEKQYVVAASCLKNIRGQVVSDGEEIINVWKTDMEKLLNKENDWNKDTSTTCGKNKG